MSIKIYDNVKALIFDCDGTLADTMGLHFEAWREALDESGISCEKDFFDQYAGYSSEKIVGIINTRFGSSLDVEAICRVKEANFESKLHRITPIEPVVELARASMGKLPMAVVSGGVRKNVDATLETLGLVSAFPVIITASDPIPPKPAPDIFLEAAKRLGVAPEFCQVFEDAEAGIIGAQAAGMFVTDVRQFVL